MTNVIALCGYKGSGKDYATNHIIEKYEYEHYKIAHKLKKICMELFDFTYEQVEYNKEVVDTRWGITPRRAMQYVGTELFQYNLEGLLPNMDKTFWIMNMVNEIKIKKPKNVIISDLRFLHEYKYLNENFNLKVVKIVTTEDKTDNHISELEYLHIPYDYVINNKFNNDFILDLDTIMKL